MFKVRCTPVAIAVALTLSPIAALADGGFYGSLRMGLQYFDDGNDPDGAEINTRDWGTRLGFGGETDVGNGLTAHGNLEFRVTTRDEDIGDNGVFGLRYAYVGLKGSFGSLVAGKTYHTFYNSVIAVVDQPWWGSCNGCIEGSNSRTSDGITYTGQFGLLTFGATGYLIRRAGVGEGATNAETLDAYEVGGRYDAGFANIGVAIANTEGREMVIGASIDGVYGAINYAANITMQDAGELGGEDFQGIDVFLSYGQAYLDIGQRSAGIEETGFTLGYTYPLGQDLTSWFEVQSVGSDADGVEDQTVLRAALKYDWE